MTSPAHSSGVRARISGRGVAVAKTLSPVALTTARTDTLNRLIVAALLGAGATSASLVALAQPSAELVGVSTCEQWKLARAMSVGAAQRATVELWTLGFLNGVVFQNKTTQILENVEPKEVYAFVDVWCEQRPDSNTAIGGMFAARELSTRRMMKLREAIK